MKTRLEILEAAALRTQQQAGAAWQDLMDGRMAGLSEKEMQVLVRNWDASATMESASLALYRAAQVDAAVAQ
jgi:hypothetical protein